MVQIVFKIMDRWKKVVETRSEFKKGWRRIETNPKLLKHYILLANLLEESKILFTAKYEQRFFENSNPVDFQRIKTLGAGAFGRVMLVRNELSRKLYALKVIEKEHLVKLKQVEHTMSEIRVLDAIKFEFLVSLEFFFKDNVYLYLGMPFIQGGEMFSHLRERKMFDENLSKFYSAQVIMALEYLHYVGLVYRDLKPENILIDREGYLKIADMGFCKKIDNRRTYTLCGTPEYLAPEVILSKGYGYAVDWWALGVLMYEMVAGFPPFFSRDPMKVYEKIVTGIFTCPSHFTKSLKGLLSHVLEVDLSMRYGNLFNGANDIKSHEWFKGVDWDGILQRKVKPTFVPQITNEEDTSNFDFWEEEPLRMASLEEYPDEFYEIKVKSVISQANVSDDD